MSEANRDFMIKTESEIKNMKLAQEITEKTLNYVLPKLKTGVTELEIAAEINKEFLRLGADGQAFDTIVAFGKNAAECHHVPNETELEKGDIVLIDIGAKYNGYCSDMTRTFCFGTPSAEIIKIFKLVLESQNLVLKHLKAGYTGREADAIAREYLKANGYDKQFCHTLGHGVGKEIHEEPRLATYSDTVLEENMVVTVEPGIYIEGFGGVRIEDMVVIKKGGIINLTGFDKSLIIQKE